MSIGKFVRQEIIDLISASWSPYWGGSSGPPGPSGGGTPGAPLNSIQYNSGSSFSGSANFTFISSSNSVYLSGSLFLSGAINQNGSILISGSIRQTGSIFLSGAISASFGPNTVGFFGTSSWAVSSSRATTASFAVTSAFAVTASYIRLIEGPNIDINYTVGGIEISASASPININGIDEYMSRFSGSNGLETSSFINRRGLASFAHANFNNQPFSGSFIVGKNNTHKDSYFGNSLGEWTQIVNNSSSLAANFGTSIDANYSVAINKYSGVARKVRFRGYVVDPTITAEGNSFNAALVDPDAAFTSIEPGSLNASLQILIYNENTGKIALVKTGAYKVSTLVTSPYTGTSGATYSGFGIAFSNSITDIYGNAFTAAAGTNSFLVFFLQGGDNSVEANFASGLATNAYGTYNASLGNQTAAIEHANLSAGIGSITKNSGSVSLGYKLGTDAKFSNNFGALNAVGRVYECQTLTRTTRTDPIGFLTYDVNIFRNFENSNTDVYSYLAANGHDEIVGRTDFPAIVLIPSIEYCGIVGLLALSDTAATPGEPVVGTRYDILPPGLSNIADKDIRIIIPFDTAATFTDTRTPNLYTYAATAIGVNNISAGSGSFVGGKNSKAKGSTSFAFGNAVSAIADESTAIGVSIANSARRSFAVGYSGINLFVSNSAVGVNSTTPPNSTYNGLYVYQDLWVNRDTTIGQNLLVTGSSFLGNDLNDRTIVTGSLIVSNSFQLIGTGRVTGSLFVSSSLDVVGRLTVSGTFIESGSYNLIGTGAATGSLIVSNSFTVIGNSVVSGSNNISGSWNLTGVGRVSGSLIVSNSLDVVGRLTVSGAFIDSGSFNLIGIGNVTGSLIVSNSLSVVGSSDVTGSNNISGSWQLIGTGRVTGSLFVSNSLGVTGNLIISGTNVITGSSNVIGTSTVTGSLIVSNSFTVIGTNTTTGSVFITGSSTLIGNQTITGSIFMTGSAAISSVNYIDFVTSSAALFQVGRIHWDNDYGTVNIDLNSTSGNAVEAKVGLDNFYYIKNQTGGTLTKGKVIRADGTLGSSGRLLGNYMIADGTIPYYYTLGIAAENIGNGQDGYVYEFGLLRGIQTNGANYGETWVDGTILYVSTSSLGGLTSVEPIAPNPKIQIAIVIKSDNSNGSIFIRPDLRSNIYDLHDVKITAPSASGDLLVYSSSLWINSKQLTGSYGLTGSLSITNGGITGSLFGTASWATSASVALTASLSSNVLGGEQYRIAVWKSATELSSSAATDNGSLFLISRNTAVTGTFEINVPTATNQTQPALGVNSAGVFFIGKYSVAPTATDGGIYYDGTDFYLGYQ